MRAHGLKYLATGLLLTLVGLPGHGRERAPGARPRQSGEMPKAAPPAPCEKVNIGPGSIDLCSIDVDHVHVDVSGAMRDAECALADADVQAEHADVENDVENLD